MFAFFCHKGSPWNLWLTTTAYFWWGTSTNDPATGLEVTPNWEGTLETKTCRWVTAPFNPFQIDACTRVYSTETVISPTGTPSSRRNKSTAHDDGNYWSYSGLKDNTPTRGGKRWQDLFRAHNHTANSRQKKKNTYWETPFRLQCKCAANCLQISNSSSQKSSEETKLERASRCLQIPCWLWTGA